MNQLNFSTGKITYTVNGNCEISFNPSDAEFAGKLFDVFSSFAKNMKNLNRRTPTLKMCFLY